ncbi:MAG TPA: response regulator, partial [Longimicrobium sp.]|nr:response regulator [Longimicrobium sp.]
RERGRVTGTQPLVLVVEDSEAIRAAFTILLEESGYTVAAVPTGGEAVRLAGERLPDLVLLDLGLPDISGIDVARRIKANPATRHIPVVALTGRDDDGDREALLAAGCSGFWLKPVDTQALIRSLPGYIASAAAAPG